MTKGFDNAFDDFLMERIGDEISRLREKNERYRSAAIEYSELVGKAERGGIDDYKQAFDRLNELSIYIRDLESRYLFYAGMAARKRMDDTISPDELPDRFAE